MNRAFLAAFIGGAMLGCSATSATALPTMIRLGYADCAACHISPQGGGPLTVYGRGIDEAQSLRAGEYKPSENDLTRLLTLRGRITQDVRAVFQEQGTWTSGPAARLFRPRLMYRNVSELGGGFRISAILTTDTAPSSKQETEEILEWKAEQSFGTPAGELRISKQKIATDREGRLRWFANAVKLSVLDEYETVFESMGWKAGLILPRVVSEARWLHPFQTKDSLLVSAQADGFTALLLRNGEPRVVRSVTCSGTEIDDEMYRLLMFYNDRFGDRESLGFLDSLLVIGRMFDTERIKAISAEAFGRAVDILRPSDVGLETPPENLSFHDIAAPTGLAALGFR
jgi:hypothetical protein